MSERKRVDIKAILVDPVLREEIVEGATDFICKVEGIRPHSFSPAAQAVLNAYGNEVGWPRPYEHERHGLAAALRAAEETNPMTQQHPITPPDELVEQWVTKYWGDEYIATQAARWGNHTSQLGDNQQ